jgi:hypothetical protein
MCAECEKFMFDSKHNTAMHHNPIQPGERPIMDTYERADDTLGSIYWALRGFNREELLEISDKFLAAIGLEEKKPLEVQTETELRNFLRKCALKIYRRTPEKLEPIRKYLTEYGRANLKGLFE